MEHIYNFGANGFENIQIIIITNNLKFQIGVHHCKLFQVPPITSRGAGGQENLAVLAAPRPKEARTRQGLEVQ